MQLQPNNLENACSCFQHHLPESIICFHIHWYTHIYRWSGIHSHYYWRTFRRKRWEREGPCSNKHEHSNHLAILKFSLARICYRLASESCYGVSWRQLWEAPSPSGSTSFWSAAESVHHVYVSMMMIAFITFNSSLVPLIESLCSSNPWEFETYMNLTGLYDL